MPTLYSRKKSSTYPVNDSRLGRIVRRHLHFYLVAYHQPYEPLSHFTRYVGKNLVITSQLNLEHRTSENR